MVLLLHLCPLLLLLPELAAGLAQDVRGEQDGGEAGDVWPEVVASQAGKMLLQACPAFDSPHREDIRHCLHVHNLPFETRLDWGIAGFAAP